MSEGDGDIEDGLQRQGEERDTRFDAGAEGGDAEAEAEVNLQRGRG